MFISYIAYFYLRYFSFFFFKDLLIYCIYSVLLACILAGQKREPDLITEGCWELNSGPLEEQSVLLTSEPSLQPNDNDSLKTLQLLQPATMLSSAAKESLSIGLS